MTKASEKVFSLLEKEKIQNWRLLMYAFEGLFHGLETSLAREGFSISRFKIMFFLYSEEALAPVDLARKLLVSRANISTFLKRMIADDLVMECPNSKSTKRPCYCLTKKGKKSFEDLFPRHCSRVEKLMISFSKNTVADLKELKSHVDKIDVAVL